MKLRCSAAAILLLQIFILSAKCQNLKDLSYSGGDFGTNPYARPVATSSTTAAPTTTKAGFFGGIRNYFRSEKTTEPPVVVPVTQPSTPKVNVPVVTPSVPQNVPSSGPARPQSLPVPLNPNFPPQPPPRGSFGQAGPQPMPQMPNTPTNYRPPPSIPTNQNAGRPLPPTPSTPTAVNTPVNPWGGQPSTAPTGNANNFPPLPPPRTPVDRDFPALPSRPGSSTGSVSPPLNPAWSASGPRPSFPAPPPASSSSRPSSPTPSRPAVQFVPRQPTPGSRPQSPTRATPGSTNPLATDTELTDLSEALISKDVNNVAKYITVNEQGRTQSSAITDEAPSSLLTINETVVFAVPSIAKLRELYNNYEIETNVNEHVTPNERREENEFLDAIMSTTVMRHAMQFLQDKGIVSPDPRTHRDLVKGLWFNMYSRGGGKIGSSAFEHIFLAEKRNNTIMGLHNWVYFYEKEKAGTIDYKGYIKKVDIGNKGSLMKIRFSYDSLNKPVNSMFIGTSPELEIAIYTLCFELRPDTDCPVSLNGKTFKMATHTFRYRGKNLIGSAFAEI